MTCPDCSQKSNRDGHLKHAATCPLGHAEDRQLADDRDWFDRHPFAPYRRRPPHWSEVEGLRMVGAIPGTGEVFGEVVVVPLAPGVRAKRFDQLWVAP